MLHKELTLTLKDTTSIVTSNINENDSLTESTLINGEGITLDSGRVMIQAIDNV